jgi:phage-related protein
MDDWIVSLDDKKHKAAILHVLETFEMHGPINSQLPKTRLKHLHDSGGIWEMRTGQYRIAYFWNGQCCVLLHGIVKKRNDWSVKDIKLAKKRKSNYCSNPD